MTAEFYLNQ